jgi:osmotically-inducible protein OsmY
MNKKLGFIILLTLLAPLLSGCVTVVDAITDKPIQPDPNKRSFGTYWDDKQLRTIVSVNIKKASDRFKDGNVNVYSFNGVILLTGEVPSHELRDLADATARDVNRVRQVYNELVVAPKRGFIANTTDAWLGSKIKTKLFAYKDIDSSKVEVIVEDHTVYLMGLLTRAQTEKITNVVRKTNGVRKVVRAIEYID